MNELKKRLEILSYSKDRKPAPEDVHSKEPNPGELESFGIHSNEPGQYELDLDTPMETLLKVVSISTFLLFCLVIQLKIDDFPPLIFFKLLIGFVALLSGLLSRNIDNLFVLDTDKKVLFYRFSLPFFQRTSRYASFDEIAYSTVTGSFGEFNAVEALEKLENTPTGRDPTGAPPPAPFPYAENIWEYVPILILKDGRSVQIADFRKEGLIVVNRKAELISKLIGCPFIPAPKETVAVVLLNPQTKALTVTHRSRGRSLEAVKNN